MSALAATQPTVQPDETRPEPRPQPRPDTGPAAGPAARAGGTGTTSVRTVLRPGGPWVGAVHAAPRPPAGTSAGAARLRAVTPPDEPDRAAAVTVEAAGASESVTVTVRVGAGDGARRHRVLDALRELIAAAGDPDTADPDAADPGAADPDAADPGAAGVVAGGPGAGGSGAAGAFAAGLGGAGSGAVGPAATWPGATFSDVTGAATAARTEGSAVTVPTTVGAGAVQIHPEPRTVLRGGRALALSRLEFDLLLFLARHPRRVFSRHQLLHQVWGHGHTSVRTVDVHVSRLRSKLGDTSAVITTVYGVGYRLADDAAVAVHR